MWTKLRAVIFFCETAVVSNAFLRNWLTRLISSRMPDVRPLCSHERTQRHKVCGDLLDAVKLATEDVIIVKQQHIRRKAFEIQHHWCHEFSKECPNILPCHISSQRDDEKMKISSVSNFLLSIIPDFPTSFSCSCTERKRIQNENCLKCIVWLTAIQHEPPWNKAVFVCKPYL